MCYKKQEYFPVQGTNYKLPITIIQGAQEGKTLLFSAGVHGCEYVSIEALKQWAKEVNAEEVYGRIICIHLANPEAFRSRIPELVPEDNKNLNRVFPGSSEGTASEKLAYIITKDFHQKTDYYVDLHGGDQHEGLSPLVFFPGTGTDKVVDISRKMASVLTVSERIVSRALHGTYNSAAILGIPSIMIERGGRGTWSKKEVKRYKDDLYNVSMFLGFFGEKNRKTIKENKNQREVKNAKYLNASTNGFWYPQVKPGDFVVRGQKMGVICDDFGNVIEELVSKEEGKILYMTETLALKKGEPLLAKG